ncbi:MAG: hypothetical protein J6O55_03455, partial [Lachnospiraceae bacterium]|nr:hypothetical protein [Lachnospiraceae bacterium]
ISWILMPPGRMDIFTIIMLMFYYFIGTSLERTWGDFRYNLYIFTGLFFTLIGAFGIYFFGTIVLHYPPDVFGSLISGINPLTGALSTTGAVSTYYINMSLYYAFALSYPDVQVLLYFIIPVKIKWLAVLNAVFLIWDLVQRPWYGKVIIAVSLLNFMLFFLSTRDLSRINPSEMKRKSAFRRSVDEARRRGFTSMNGGNAPRDKVQISKHRCAICGQTELTNPDLEFRFCSKCNGNYEYCTKHLFTHKHVE